MKTLVAGWFSFRGMGATAGDLLARDLVSEWLDAASHRFDVALAPPFEGGVDWRRVDPSDYSQVVFVCGPFGNGPPITDFLLRFAHCRLVGVDLSMLQALDEWDPFDVLIERDSSRTANPDITFLAATRTVPLVGVVRVHPQSEYGDRGLHSIADDVIEELLSNREVARISIDTRLDENSTGLRTPEQVESTIGGMDAVVTTRLHGLVLALKNGVPALAIDPIAGGAKIARQASTIGWPVCFTADSIDLNALAEGLDFCLSDAGRRAARECAARARRRVEEIRDRFVAAVDRDR